MLLAVAGLSEKEVKQRTQQLAEGDWSDFAPAERLAFRFAHDLTTQPWAVNDSDVQTLVETFGAHRAMDLIWYAAWCNYMTRVADAFQLQLESENVFEEKQPEDTTGKTEEE